MQALTQLLEIKLRHATLKHPQTVGVVERAHSCLKWILQLNTDEQWLNWHKYVPLALFIHNTSYSTSINCCPTAIFHGREPLKPVDLRFSRKALESIEPESDYFTALQDAMLQKFRQTKQNLIDAYHKYRGYYDMKAQAQPLKLHGHCLLLNPILTTQSDFSSKGVQTWLALYRVEKILTNSNYIIRKVGTNFTQCVHRIRLRPISLLEPPEDATNINPDNFQPDPSLSRYRGEPDIFDDRLPSLFEEQESPSTARNDNERQSSVSLSIPLPGLPPAILPAAPPALAPIPNPPLAGPAAHDEDHPPENRDHDGDRLDANDALLPVDREALDENALEDLRERSNSHREGPQRRVTFNESVRIRYSQSPEPKYRRVIRTIDGTEVAPTSFTDPYGLKLAKKKHLQRTIQQKKSDPTLSKEMKRDLVKSSIKRARDSLRNEQGSSNEGAPDTGLHTLDSANKAQFIEVFGNILNFRGSIGHCVSSDFAMKKGIAHQIHKQHPAVQHRTDKVPPGHVFFYYDTLNTRFIYNLITKYQFFEKPTYYELNRCLRSLAILTQKHNLDKIALPRLGCGLDKLNWFTVTHLIWDNFRNLPITVYIFS